jgi:hypothetical protein
MDKNKQSDINFALLDTLFDRKLVLQHHGDKSHLYSAYRSHVEEELRILKKEIDNSTLADIERFPGLVGSLESLEEMLNSYNKEIQDNLRRSIITVEQLLKMERYNNICFSSLKQT